MLLSEVFAARLVLGIVFLLSGFSKLKSRDSLTDDIMEYRLLSRAQAQVLARVLPYGELIIGTLCVGGLMLLVTSGMAGVLLCAFTVAIAINLQRGRRFDCHCFSKSKSQIGLSLVLRNIVLIAVAIFVGYGSVSTDRSFVLSSHWDKDLALVNNLSNVVATFGIALLLSGVLFLLSYADMAILSSKSTGRTS